MNTLLKTIKPAIPKRYLMFLAALVWLFAGGMLLYKGITFMKIPQPFLIVKIVGSVLLGLLFFAVLFSKIATKHISRIRNIKHEKPCLFSFFNWKSYAIMGSMISLGILLRVFKIVPAEYLSFFYLVMGIPLLLSALRFLSVGYNRD